MHEYALVIKFASGARRMPFRMRGTTRQPSAHAGALYAIETRKQDFCTLANYKARFIT
jgi:hypothetical protein